jgi:hypothetical protein
VEAFRVGLISAAAVLLAVNLDGQSDSDHSWQDRSASVASLRRLIGFPPER